MTLVSLNISRFYKNTKLSLVSIGILSFIIKIYYFPHNIPLTEDAFFYFRYAIDASIVGHLPDTPLINNAWPLLLSVFFSLVHSNNFLDYVEMQRLISVLISTLTIIPVYLLIRRFFEPRFALFGTLMFAVEPRTTINSLLGITEPLYILFVTIILYFLLSQKIRIVYLSFLLIAVTIQIRYEAAVLIFSNSIAFFSKYGKQKSTLLKFGIAIGLFCLVLLPLEYIKTITYGVVNNGGSQLLTGAAVYGRQVTSYSNDTNHGIFSYVTNGLISLIKYLGWITVPYYVIFVPLGFYLMITRKSKDNSIIIFSIIVLSIPALYAYSRGIQETRYLYVLYPIFSVLSVYCIKFLADKRREIFYISIGIILILSILFLNYKMIDFNHEKEAFEIAKYISREAKTVNSYYPESRYLAVSNINENFPVLSNLIPPGAKEINTNFQSLPEFINYGKKDGLDYIVVDDKKDRPQFLTDVFNNDAKYPYLIKQFDSSEIGYGYHVKIYKIDYEKFTSSIER